jgi:hypothetical protein
MTHKASLDTFLGMEGHGTRRSSRPTRLTEGHWLEPGMALPKYLDDGRIAHDIRRFEDRAGACLQSRSSSDYMTQ